jgi:ribosome-associated toxin RatA of RatAB toxin-antitoxin module
MKRLGMFLKVFILLLTLTFASPSITLGYDNFHEEVTPLLKQEGIWVVTEFKKDETMATTTFRAWLPFKAEDCWKIMTDTNNYKIYSKDYKDSRTLDKNQFESVKQKSPTTIKHFYEIIGHQEFPSDQGRLKGKSWMSYTLLRFNLPWPLADRWAMMNIKNDESSSTKNEYHYEYKSMAGNFKELKGYWKLIPVPNKPGWTEFRGEYKADPGIAVPQFLAKKIFRNSMKQTIETYQKVLEGQGAIKSGTNL